MSIFSLSTRLMDFDNLNLFPVKIVYFLPPKFSEDESDSVLYSAMWTLDTYYEQIKEIPMKIGYQNNVLTREMLKNSRWHGGSKDDSPTYFGLFIDKEKFILASCDGGDYFKRQDIKEIWESKGKLAEFHNANKYGVGYHIGYGYFKDKFDEIKIDNEEGVLYGIVNIENYLKKSNLLKLT